MFGIGDVKRKQERKQARKAPVTVMVNGQKVKIVPRSSQVTHLTEQSASKMTRNVQELNKKVLQFINNQ